MASLLLANPAPRRRRRADPKRKVVARAPIRRRRRTTKTAATAAGRALRYRRNPVRRLGGIMEQVQGAAIGAAGALVVDFAMGKIPLPLTLQTGAMRSATQGAVSIGIGMLVSNFMRNKKLGEQIAGGGLTVALYGMGKNAFGAAMGLQGNDLLGNDLLGSDGQLLGYGSYQNPEMGWLSPAPVSYGGESYGFSGIDDGDLESYQSYDRAMTKN